MKPTILTALTLAVLLGCAGGVEAASLLDADVTATNYSPDLSTIYGTPGSGPTTGIVETNGFTFAFTANTIVYTDGYTGSYTSVGPEGFNGFVLKFTGAPSISGVTLDPTSEQVPSSLYSTANKVFIDFNGGSQVAGQTAIIDVSFGASVPEPTTWAMVLVGCGSLGTVMRFRRRAMMKAAA